MLSLSNYIQISKPWPLTIYQNVLTEEHRQELLDLFGFSDDNPESSWNELTDRNHWLFTEALKIKNDPDFVIKLKKDSPHHTLQHVHRDLMYSTTAQLVVQDDSYYNGGGIIHASKDSPGFEMPFLSNSLIVFDNNEDSWHSVRQRGYERRSVLIRWNK